MIMTLNQPNRKLFLAISCLTISAFLFSIMGICIRYASQTVDNYTIVFFRNFVGLMLFLPFIMKQGTSFVKTEKLWMHTWRSLVGLAAMYGFFYAIAHLKLSNAMVFTYSSPIFIPLIAWLFLKERITKAMLMAAALGFLGVFCVAKPDQGLWNWVSAIGIASSLLASMAFVTVRALTKTEPPERIVFYFCLIGSVLSAIPMFWVWRPYALKELFSYCSRNTCKCKPNFYVSCLSPCSSGTDSTSQLHGDYLCWYLGLLLMARNT